MLAALGAAALALGVIVLSVFLLGLGTLLKRGACTLRGECGVGESTAGRSPAKACAGCPSTRSSSPQPTLEV